MQFGFLFENPGEDKLQHWAAEPQCDPLPLFSASPNNNMLSKITVFF